MPALLVEPAGRSSLNSDKMPLLSFRARRDWRKCISLNFSPKVLLEERQINDL
jgi:hypothetical protein